MLPNQLRIKTLSQVSSTETFRHMLRKNNVHPKVTRKKQKKNQKVNIQFASEYLLQDFEFQSTVMFVDESKFNIFGTDGRFYMRRNPGKTPTKTIYAQL